MITMEIKGLKELNDQLRKLDGRQLDDACSEAIHAGGTVMTDRLKAAAPEASQYYPDVPKGFLKENVNLKVKKIRKIWYAYCGPDPHVNYPERMSTVLTKTGKVRKKPLKRAKYARGPWLKLVAAWLEFGHHDRTGGHFVSPHPWMRPVWATTWKRSLDAMNDKLRQWLKEMSR
jgi:hypothetical protein